MLPHHSLILAQVSISAAMCQNEQSAIVSGAAGVEGSVRYAAPRQGSAARPSVNRDIMVQMIKVVSSPMGSLHAMKCERWSCLYSWTICTRDCANLYSRAVCAAIKPKKSEEASPKDG